jgi:hypothetical protein
VRRADNLTAFMRRLCINYETLNLLNLYGLLQACNGIALPFTSLMTRFVDGVG